MCTILIHGIISEMNTKNLKNLIFFSLIVILSACVPSGQLSLPDSAFTEIPPTVTPSPTLSPTITQTSTPLLSPTPLPSPTSTPRIHTVKLGETLGGIAWIYGVSVDKLMEMNPEIDPYVLTVDMQVVIPVETLPPANQTPEPTPVQLPLEGLNCLLDENSGVWCFVWVNNTSDESYENVIVSFNLADLDASEVNAIKEPAPLNVLSAGEKMPVAAYFPGPNSNQFQKSAQFSSAIPYNPESKRYLNAEVSVESETTLLNNKLLTIEGNFQVADPVSKVTIVAVALDQNEQIIGFREWQADLSEPTVEGNFSLDLSAVSGIIEDYQLFIEAQPADSPN